MIEQQYYTRERGGLFNQTDGYDTVAKSPQLKLDYIKKVLHPICVYDMPYELQTRGEQDENCYPPCMVILPGTSGEMIVGQAVYKARDFTGLRSTFFMHNLILSENEKRRFIKDPEKLFGITGFKTQFNLSEGRQLPTLAGIDYDANNPYFLERERLFNKLGLSQEVFHKMLGAIFIAVHSKKKVYIALNVAIEELGPMAKALLYHLYVDLPWGITEQLGVCTYANKLEAKKNIHITFLDKNAIRYDQRGKDFIFDFVNKKYPTMEGDIESEPYITGRLAYCKNRVAWEKINHWAEVFRTTFKDQSECGLSFYGRVIILFEMSLYLRAGKWYDLTPVKVRKGLLKQILLYLQSPIADDIRKELFDIMEYCIQLLEMEMEQDKLLAEEELRMVLAFKLDYCSSKEQEAHCMHILLHLLSISSKNKDYGYVYNVLNLVHTYSKMYLYLFEACYEREGLRKDIVYYLVNASFEQVESFEDLVEQMKCFQEVESVLITDRYYEQLIYEKFNHVLKQSNDLMGFLEKLQKWASSHKEPLYTNLLEEGEYYFLEHLSLKNIENDTSLCKLKFTRSYPLENYEVIQGYQKLRTDLSYMSPNKICINGKVQELVKKFLYQKAKQDDFYMLVYAFLEPDSETHKPTLNLKKALHYLYSIEMRLMLDFIIWAKGQEMYIDKVRFDNDVMDCFLQIKKKQGKVDKELIKSKLGAQAKTKVLCQKIIEILKPSLIKWVQAHRIMVGIMAVILVIAGGGAGFYRVQQQGQTVLEEVVQIVPVAPKTVAKLMPNYTEDKEEAKALLKEKLDRIDKNYMEKIEAHIAEDNKVD